MSDEEMEAFQITDYDLDNEFNLHRPRRKMSKKQQMLGKVEKIHSNITSNSIIFSIFKIYINVFISFDELYFHIFSTHYEISKSYLLQNNFKNKFY